MAILLFSVMMILAYCENERSFQKRPSLPSSPPTPSKVSTDGRGCDEYTIFDQQKESPFFAGLDHFNDEIISIASHTVPRVADPLKSHLQIALLSLREAKVLSAYDIFTMVGAVHFYRLAICHTDPSNVAQLNEIVFQLLQSVSGISRPPFVERITRLYKSYENQFPTLFGDSRTGNMAFEFVIIAIQLDTIPVTIRHDVMSSFTKFLNEAERVSDNRGRSVFNQATIILQLREHLNQEVILPAIRILSHPLQARPTTVDDPKRLPSTPWQRLKQLFM